ncbi:MAG: citramalate synthase [Bacillota bacterium]|nr:citramalate synthase [Bacillota bacterium]
MRKIQIFDSTLRDGAQGEGISYSVRDKLAIVQALDEFKVDYIEAGNPASNPKDIEFFEKLRGKKLSHAKLCAFGSTRRKGVKPEDDAGLLSLINTGAPTVSIFGKSWDLHVDKVLRVSREENLDLVYSTIKFLKDRGLEVVFDAEHYFDGVMGNEDYALKVLGAAMDAGADCLCLCDTNGGTLPHQITSRVLQVRERFPDANIGIHCHNDTGCAVASSIAAVEAGAMQVQGTFVGTGERCGNADLSIIIPNLQLKMGYSCVDSDLSDLFSAVRHICELSNIGVYQSKPYVGDSAFAHKGGMHIDGVNKLSSSFEHIDPKTVGNSRRFLMSEVSGRTTVIKKLEAVAPDLDRESPEVAQILEKIKQLENQGYQYEAADASFEMMALRTLGRFNAHFTPIIYRTSGEYPPPAGERSASAILSIQVDGREETTAAMGNGPVNALDIALRKALAVFYPGLSEVRLTDYKVRVLTGAEATASKVRVLIQSTDGDTSWNTVGVGTDVVAASWEALCDSLEYVLHRKDKKIS